MILRTVLAVLLALALLGVALPVVDSARVEHANTTVTNTLERLDAEAQSLVAESDPVYTQQSGARRSHTLRVPAGSWATASLDQLVVPPNGSDQPLVWRIEGGQRHTYRPAVPVVGHPGSLTIRDGGTHRLVLSLQYRNGREVVVVRRPDV